MAPSDGVPAAPLPPDQLKRIEDAVYRAVVARLLRGLLVSALIVVASVAAVGWLSWSMVKRTLVSQAAATLQTDTLFRTDLLAGLGLDSTTVTHMLDSLGAATLQGGAENEELRRLIEELMGSQGAGARPTPRGRTIR